MVTQDDLKRARLARAVRWAATPIIADLDVALNQPPVEDESRQQYEPVLALPRISSLANSLAWHVTRPAPGQRVAEFFREIERQEQKTSETSSSRLIYQRLRTALDAESEPVIRALRAASVTDEDYQILTDAARLMLAHMLIEALLILARGSRVRQVLTANGGAIQWP